MTNFDDEPMEVECVNCHSLYEYDETDIELCDQCRRLFNLEKLWKDHDARKVDALDFNEYTMVRNKYRRPSRTWENNQND